MPNNGSCWGATKRANSLGLVLNANATQEMNRGWGELPPEVLLMIMSYMDAKEVARAGAVNYHWKRVSEDDSLWRPLFIRDFKLPLNTKLKGRDCWIEEYKMLKFEAPVVLCEDLRDCVHGLVHVCFAPDGLLFCTTTNDGSFKIWTATTPTYLVHERRLRETLDWERATYAQFSPDSASLLVCGIKNEGSGEVAVFSVDGEECEVHFLCRAPNNPSEFLCCWYDNSHILTGDVYYFDRNSVIGTSATQIYLCSAQSPWDKINDAFLSPILRLLNRHGGLCQLITLGRFIPPRLRGVVLLAEEARVENKTLAVKVQELTHDIETGVSEEERRAEMRRRLEELSASAQCSCSACTSNHEGISKEDDYQICACGCHDDDDRLLIHAYGDTSATPPHAIALKIVDGETVSRVAHRRCTINRNDGNRSQQRRRAQADTEDQLSSILALFDLPDYVIDMRAHVMGFTLSLNHRYLFVNVTHDHFGGDEFNCLAETRLINLETLAFEGSYFGHFASLFDRFPCSVGGHCLASASMEGGRVWSKDHHCLVGKLQHSDGAGAIAVEPLNGEMIVSIGRTDGRIKIWRCKKYLQKPYLQNDFM